jgi:hypothetical protein
MLAELAYKNNRIYEARRNAYNALFKAKTPFVREQTHKMMNFLDGK